MCSRRVISALVWLGRSEKEILSKPEIDVSLRVVSGNLWWKVVWKSAVCLNKNLQENCDATELCPNSILDGINLDYSMFFL